MPAPKMTRRALVAGIAASSTVALPSLASSPAGDDSELLRLEAELATANKECEAADEALVAARRALPDWARGPYPVLDADARATRPHLLATLEKDDWDQVNLKAIREFNWRTEGMSNTGAIWSEGPRATR